MTTSRPTRTVQVQQRISATRSIKHELTRFVDTTAFDAMHHVAQLSDRQYAAACRLYGYFLGAGLLPRATPRYRTVPIMVETIEEDGDAMEPEEARATYRRILRDAGQAAGPILDALMHGQHPGMMLPTLQDALGVLADGWGMER